MATKSITLSFTISPLIPTILRLDKTRYMQLLMNLISNAFKFTSEFGKVDISFTLEQEEKTELVFRIQDTGRGIESSRLTEIFQPYVQVAHQDEYKGSGLGLAICRKIVEMYEGSISVESEIGVGTTFTAKIPVEVEEASPRTTFEHIIEFKDEPMDLTRSSSPTIVPEHDTSLSSTPLLHDISSPSTPLLQNDVTILIADDAAINRQILRKMISRIVPTATILEAEDGLHAVQVFDSHRIDVVCMDIVMPRMDGYEATQEIRKRDINVPVIICTANMTKDPATVQKLEELGIQHVLSKPFTLASLRRIFEALEIVS